MITTTRRELRGTNPLDVYPLDDAADIKPGDIACENAEGKIVEASDAAGLVVRGIAVKVDKKEKTVEVRDGIVALDLAESNTPERKDRGKPVYAVSATEVAISSDYGVIAGCLVDVYEGEAYVDVRPGNATAAEAGATAGAVAGATAGGTAGDAAIAADLVHVDSQIKAATLNAEGNVRLVEVPAGIDAPGVKGDIAYDDTHIYICVDEDTWVRAALAKDATWETTV